MAAQPLLCLPKRPFGGLLKGGVMMRLPPLSPPQPHPSGPKDHPYPLTSRPQIASLSVLRDMAAGLAYLHAKNIIHADLKPPNTLLKSCEDTPVGFTAKLSVSHWLGGHFRASASLWVLGWLAHHTNAPQHLRRSPLQGPEPPCLIFACCFCVGPRAF